MVFNIEENTRPTDCFSTLQNIINIIKTNENRMARTDREAYLLSMLDRIDRVARLHIQPEYEKVIAPLIEKIQRMRTEENPHGSGRLVCPRCHDQLIYAFGVMGHVTLQCKTPGCLHWSE